MALIVMNNKKLSATGAARHRGFHQGKKGPEVGPSVADASSSLMMPHNDCDPASGRVAAAGLDMSELMRFPGYLLARARWVVLRTFEAAVREACNLRPVEFSVLLLVATNREVTQAQLSQALGVAPPNMTGILRRLAARGLLARTRSREDARQQHLSLTAEGQRLLLLAHAQALEAENSWLGRLSPAEQAMLAELLGKIVGA